MRSPPPPGRQTFVVAVERPSPGSESPASTASSHSSSARASKVIRSGKCAPQRSNVDTGSFDPFGQSFVIPSFQSGSFAPGPYRSINLATGYCGGPQALPLRPPRGFVNPYRPQPALALRRAGHDDHPAGSITRLNAKGDWLFAAKPSFLTDLPPALGMREPQVRKNPRGAMQKAPGRIMALDRARGSPRRAATKIAWPDCP